MERTILQQGIMLQEHATKMAEMEKTIQKQANLMATQAKRIDRQEKVIQVVNLVHIYLLSMLNLRSVLFLILMDLYI